MEIMSEGNRLHAEEPLEMLHALLEGFQGLVVFHVPDVVAEEGVIFVGDAKGILQFRAGCKNLGNFKWKFDGEGRVSP